MSLQGGQWPVGHSTGLAGSSVRGCCIVLAMEQRKRDVTGLTRKAVMGKAAWGCWTNIQERFKDRSAYLADSQTRNTQLSEKVLYLEQKSRFHLQKAALETGAIEYLPIKGAQSTMCSHCNGL